MKMTPENFKHLSGALIPYDVPHIRSVYKANGLSIKRYQWDLVRKAGVMPWLCDVLYKYLNDDHIQTALNKIIKPL